MNNLHKYLTLKSCYNLVSFDNFCRGTAYDENYLTDLLILINPLEELHLVNNRERDKFEKELKFNNNNVPKNIELYLQKDYKNFELKLQDIFKKFREDGLSYYDLMVNSGNDFDYDVTENIMKFFSEFKSSKKYTNKKPENISYNSFFNKAKELGGDDVYVGESNFCMKIRKGDIRFCVKHLKDNKTKSLQSLYHEYGHYLLEKQLNTEFVDIFPSLSMHEAHSFMWQFYFNPNKIQAVKNTKRVFNSPHYYNEHVAVRFLFEKEMLNNPYNSPIKLLNNISEKILGHQIDIFEDPHWSRNMFGYFPSYSVGHVIAAQLSEHISSNYITSDLLYEMSELEYIKKISGKDLSTDCFEKMWS